MKKLIFVFACLFLAIPCQARIIYVDADAPSGNNGQNWSNAYNYLQDALTDASSASKPVEIRVAEGIYTPDSTSANPNGTGDRKATFQLINGATLKGGYAGFGESEPNERDVSAYETILSGDLNGNDIEVNNPTDLLDEPTRAENSYHVVTGSSTDQTAVLNGFTVTGGNANEAMGPNASGGGMRNYEGSPTVANCTFAANSADDYAGGMYNYGSPIIANCTFTGNSVSVWGGGMHNVNSSAEITNCKFIRNSAVMGGGMRNVNSNLILINCAFSANSAVFGGGMYNDHSTPTLTNCTFTGNFPCAMEDDSSCPTLTNCIFWADRPREIYISFGGPPVVNYCNVQGGWPGLGNIDVDPHFIDPGYWADPCNTPDDWLDDVWVDGDYHLKSEAGRWDPNSKSWVLDDVTSPCIDAGNPGCPLGDEPNEPNNIRINMGAYGGTAEASKSPANWRSIADLTNDWVVDSTDLKVFVYYWLERGECIPSDLDRSQFVDFNDFAIFGWQWSQPSASKPRITCQIEKCDPNSFRPFATEEAIETRFTVTVKGRYIHFEDMMVANCCTDKLGLETTVEENLITVYEIEYIPGACFCICDYPVTATLGPFQPGIYTLEVYEDWGGFIGSTTVVIGRPE